VTGQYAGGEVVEQIQFTNGGTYLGYSLDSTAYTLNIDGSSPLDGSNAIEVIASSSTGETLNGNNGNDLLFGNGGIDTINGGSGNDLLVGGAGNDTLSGGDNNDWLVGGAGADTMDGGAGADTIVYTAAADSAPGTGDTINNFNSINDPGTPNDLIDLSAIDADPSVLNDQDFALVAGQTSSVVAHSVTWEQNGGNTTVRVDIDGNTASAEMTFVLTGVHSLTSDDFHL
jgi:Ca2+-binding RTX toxin-like protein